MASTYDPNQSRDLDRVRFRLSDLGNFDITGTAEVDITNTFFNDEQILGTLTEHGEHVLRATRTLALILASRFAQQPERIDEDSGIRTDWKDRAAKMRQVAKDIEGEIGDEITSPKPYVSQTVQVANDPVW